MNKKSAILIFSVLFLLSLGVLYVFGDDLLRYGEEGTTGTTTADPSPWIKGGDDKLLNITIGRGDITNGNITNFTISLNAFTAAGANISSWSFLPEPFGNLGDVGAGEIQDGSNQTNNVTNYTFGSDGTVFGGNMGPDLGGGITGGWACWNTTAWVIYCTSLSNESHLQPDKNTTATLVINVTAVDTGDEANFSINITVTDFETLGVDMSTGNSTNVTASIDAQEPRLIELNISDGNTTYANGTWSEEGTGTYILKTGLWTIRALIEDSNLDTGIQLLYSCNGSNFSMGNAAAEGDVNVSTAFTVTNLDGTNSTLGVLNNKGYVEATIDCTVQGEEHTANVNMSNESLTFVFLANDTFNHYRMLNNTKDIDLTGAFRVFYDDGDILPTIARVNVSQATVTFSDGVHGASRVLDSTTLSGAAALDGSSDYLKVGNVSFNIEVTGGYRPPVVTILWNSFKNSTSAAAAVVNSINIGSAPYIDLTNLEEGLMLNATNNTEGPCDVGISACTDKFLTPDSGADYIQTVIYDSSISLVSNASEHFVFYVLVNNTNHTHTTSAGPYRFQLDGVGPAMTMTSPSDRSITPRASITYSCRADDALSGEYMIRWQLVKPGSYGTISTNFASLSDKSQSKTFSGDDTMYPGDYIVKCIGVDNVGNEATYTGSSESDKFTVHYSTTGGAGEGAGAAADIDLSTQEEVTITEKQGVISTFTLDGTTIHTIKIKTVDEIAGTVTIVIESDPIEITLKIGETKEVDIDVDGTNDISVTLNKITDGAADITTKRLTPLPEKKPTEEVPPTEKPAEEITPEVAPSKTWLWILIIVIIVVIGVGYWFMKKK